MPKYGIEPAPVRADGIGVVDRVVAIVGHQLEHLNEAIVTGSGCIGLHILHDTRNSQAGILGIEVAESVIEADAIDLVLVDPILAGVHDELGSAIVGVVEVIEEARAFEVPDVRRIGRVLI